MQGFPHSDYSPKLVRQGVLVLSHVAGGGEIRTDVTLPPTWRPICQAAVPYLLSLPVQDLPRCWLKPSFTLLVALQPLEPPQVRQLGEVWAQFERLVMPGTQSDFMRTAVWKKLALGAHTKDVCHQPQCVLCSVLETMRHTLSRCKFMPVAAERFAVLTPMFRLPSAAVPRNHVAHT